MLNKEKSKSSHSAKNETKKTSSKELKSAKSKLDKQLITSFENYNMAYTSMGDAGNRLYILRLRAKDLISNIEFLINSIAKHPKSFDADIEEIRALQINFTEACEYAEQELKAAKTSGLTATAGIAAGASIASIAPTAAMWVATTFGTASTGTAISTLSGAVATKAALAWLGGGALSAGGGGVVAGNALLALAGPVGWGVAGASLLVSIGLFTYKKHRSNKDKKEEIEDILRNTQQVKEMEAKIKSLINETNLLMDNLTTIYRSELIDFGTNYITLPEERQLQLGVLVNTTKAIAASLGKTIE